jgi:lipoprotein-anchoring transpeptidase ErfK/SrfK
MDASYGDNMANTVKAFQTARGIAADGVIHDDAWAALNSDTAPALIPYTVGDTDVAGPFVKVPADMLEQAKLPTLGYQSALEQLSERFHISPKLLEKLNAGKKLDQAGEQINVPNVERAPVEAKAAKIAVHQDCNCLEALDDQGKPIAHYPATMGSEHDPLPIGDWKLGKPVKNPIFFYNSALFWDASEAHAKARIKPGPNNPVGVVWIPLSKEHYGIHGTPEPSTIGRAQSHGCIRLTNWDAAELADLVTPGLSAELRKE